MLSADTVRFHVNSWKAAQAFPSSELFGKQVSWAAGLMEPVTTPLADTTASGERRVMDSFLVTVPGTPAALKGKLGLLEFSPTAKARGKEENQQAPLQFCMLQK